MDDGQLVACSRDIAVIYYLTKVRHRCSDEKQLAHAPQCAGSQGGQAPTSCQDSLPQ